MHQELAHWEIRHLQNINWTMWPRICTSRNSEVIERKTKLSSKKQRKIVLLGQSFTQRFHQELAHRWIIEMRVPLFSNTNQRMKDFLQHYLRAKVNHLLELQFQESRYSKWKLRSVLTSQMKSPFLKEMTLTVS